MKTRLLWALILSTGGTALYLGIARPEVSSTPQRIRDLTVESVGALPPVQMPAMVVAEPRVPSEAKDTAEPAQNVPAQDREGSGSR